MKIDVKNVSKKFGDVTILRNINISFTNGKIYGLIGRNGSGKSVFLKMLCGFYEPTTGEILFDGVNVIKQKGFPPSMRALIEKPNFIPDLTGYENLKLLASIQNTIGDKEILQALMDVNLMDDKDKKYSKYSLGMKQKLGIAQALMERPEIVILDEPFNGVEEKTARDLRKKLKEYSREDKIVILASHIKEDIEALADEVYLFDDGSIKKQVHKKRKH